MFPAIWTVLLFTRLSLAVQIYLQPPLHVVPPSPSSISPQSARTVLLHHLGLDMFDFPGGSLKEIPFDRQFVGKGYSSALLLTVDEEVTDDILSPSMKAEFQLSNPPSTSLNISQVVESMLYRAQRVYSTIVSSSSSTTSAPVPRLLDIFHDTPSSATEYFLSETATLVSFVEEDNDDAFGAFELKSLAELASRYGKHSEQYTLAAEATRAIISSALLNRRLATAIMTYPAPTTAKRAMQPPPQSPFPGPAPQLPIGSVSTCHPSDDACANVTNSCSGRGSCSEASKAGRTCFVCSCNVTRDDQGRRQWWVGDACERKDVSGPFVLITGTVITLILLIGGSVSLLYGVGGQQLPPTLTGGAVGGHIKGE
ncbi:hypothetical protein BD410DRAFT_117401 [Rickenella mellea]|uniref:Vacuolar sorting protein Vps3844 C-terminal domain-containing protein n=1 Tax=Rickenella mellea TaxID=50990 RepID=A0A4Y7QA45_9AGAM|nr:hypothetical protein BD410DRAFT_117401 [Rickenella mellea]